MSSRKSKMLPDFNTYVKEMKTPETALVLDENKRIIVHPSGLIAIPITNLSKTADISVRKTAHRYHKDFRDMPCYFLTPVITESTSENPIFILSPNHPFSPNRSSTSAEENTDGEKMYAIVDNPSTPGSLQLRIAKMSHYVAANGHPFAYAAGFITFSKGKIISITNDAGGYHLDSTGMSEEVLTQNLIEIYASTIEAFKRCGVSNELFMEVFHPTYARGAPEPIVDRAWEICKRIGPKGFTAFSILSMPEKKEFIPAPSSPVKSVPMTNITLPPLTPVSGPPSPVTNKTLLSVQTESSLHKKALPTIEEKPRERKTSSLTHSPSQRHFSTRTPVDAKHKKTPPIMPPVSRRKK